MDVAIMYVGVTLLKYNSPIQQFIVKIIDNVVVVIANYIFSKWLIFHDNRKIVNKK